VEGVVMRYVNILNVALAIVCLIVIMNPISASDKPDEIDSYLQLKKKYDDFKYRKNIPDFESPEFKKYEESAQQDSAIIYPLLKKYFAKHITINEIDLSNIDLYPAFLPGYSE